MTATDLQPIVFVNPSEKKATFPCKLCESTKVRWQRMDLSHVSVPQLITRSRKGGLSWLACSGHVTPLEAIGWLGSKLYPKCMQTRWGEAPKIKLRRKMGWIMDQPQWCPSNLITRHPTGCRSERNPCQHLSVWDPGPAGVRICQTWADWTENYESQVMYLTAIRWLNKAV